MQVLEMLGSSIVYEAFIYNGSSSVPNIELWSWRFFD